MNQSIYGKAQAFVFSPFPLTLFPSSFNHIGRLEPNMAAHTSIRWTPSAWPRGGPAGLPLLRDKRQMEISHNTSCLNHIAGFSNPGLWLTYTGTYHYTFWSCRSFVRSTRRHARKVARGSSATFANMCLRRATTSARIWNLSTTATKPRCADITYC